MPVQVDRQSISAKSICVQPLVITELLCTIIPSPLVLESRNSLNGGRVISDNMR